MQIQDAEPLRIGSQPGYQTLAKAKDGQTDTDVMVVQWLRFGSGGFLQMIGIARADVLAGRVHAPAHRARQHRSEISLQDRFAGLIRLAALALSLVAEAGAVFGPPFDTPTRAGRSTRSPIM